MYKLLYLLPFIFIVSFVPLHTFQSYQNPVWAVNTYSTHPPSVIEECRVTEVECHIPIHLLEALVLYESSGKRSARHVNKDGSIDRGPCQFNSEFIRLYAEKFNSGRMFDPESNESIKVAGRVLASRYVELGTWRKAIASWNPNKKNYAEHVYKIYYRLLSLDKIS
jgi:hypothetical protein